MAEYLDRKTVDETIMGCTDSYEPPLVDFIVRLIAGKVLSIPTVDAELVVRCKDCKHFEQITDDYTGFCFSFTYRQMPYDGYCCYGERRAEHE